MDGLFTANYESDADKVAPKLAKVSKTASALYFWLHSRAFACRNSIGISQIMLAEKLEVSDRAMQKAVKQLVAENLITAETRSGRYGGGTVFSILNLNEASLNPEQSDGVNPSQTSSYVRLNQTDCSYNKEEIGTNKNKKDMSTSNYATEIISYLNEKAGCNYRPSTKSYIRDINARLNEGYTVDDFKRVIDTKVSEWFGNEKMERYLTPDTLFAAKNFDKYLNQPIQKPKEKERADDAFEKYATSF